MADDKPRLPVELVHHSDHPDALATFETLSKGSVGIVNIHRTLAQSPTMFARFIGLAHALRFETELDPAERELAILRVLERNGGTYEVAHHRRMGAAAGLTEAQMDATAGEGAPAALFDERQQAVLAFADHFAANQGVSADVAEQLVRHLDPRQRVELGLTLALYLGLAHLTNMLAVPGD
jgi:4-carboxymuconolactone decarboxylase